MTNLLFKEISDKEFILLRDVIFKESGINLTDRKKALMQSRLIKRLRSLNLDNYQMYYEYLIKNYDNEIVNLINSITTNKTDFFREPKHFEFIRDVVLPEFDRSNQKKIRIWSAGCSTGEEPYSIAITIAEYYKNRRMPDVKILSTDIDTNVLETGKSGVYSQEIVEEINPDILKRYFIKQKDELTDYYIVNDSITNIVYFRRLNLLNDVYPMKDKFNIIFCRNVIIYFDKNTRDKVIEKLYNYLSDTGFFFAGHSETLSNFSDKYRLIGNTIYNKVTKRT